jgi:hypothetical protein
MSLIMLLRELLGSMQRLNAATKILMIFTISWGASFVIVNTFQCWPPQYFWLRVSVQGTCFKGQSAFFISMSAISLAEDIVLLLPLPTIWKMRLSTIKKIELTGLFSIGGL